MFTVILVLYIVAFVCCLYSAAVPQKLPPWIAVLLLCIAGLLQFLPLGAHATLIR